MELLEKIKTQKLLSVLNDIGVEYINIEESILTFSGFVRRWGHIRDETTKESEGNLVNGEDYGPRNSDDIIFLEA